MTAPVERRPGAGLLARLDALGPRTWRRAEPRGSIAIAGGGVVLAVVGAVVASANVGTGDTFGGAQRASGVLVGLAIVVAGMVASHTEPRGPVGVAGTAAVVLGWPVVLAELLLHDPDDLTPVLILATLGWAVAYLVGPTRGRLFVLGAALVGLWASVAIVVADPERFLAGLFPVNLLYLPFLLLFSGFGFEDEFERPSFVGLAVTSLLIAAAYLLVSRHLDRTGRRGAGTAFVAVGIGVLAQGLYAFTIETSAGGGGVAVALVGMGLALHGGSVGRRATAWAGGVIIPLGVAMIVVDGVDDAGIAGLLLAALGVALVGWARVISGWLGEADELPPSGSGGGPAPSDPATSAALWAPPGPTAPVEVPPVARTPAPVVERPAPSSATASTKATLAKTSSAKKAAAKKAAAKKAAPASAAAKTTAAKKVAKKTAAKKASATKAAAKKASATRTDR